MLVNRVTYRECFSTSLACSSPLIYHCSGIQLNMYKYKPAERIEIITFHQCSNQRYRENHFVVAMAVEIDLPKAVYSSQLEAF